jgi:hypothetical protein
MWQRTASSLQGKGGQFLRLLHAVSCQIHEEKTQDQHTLNVNLFKWPVGVTYELNRKILHFSTDQVCKE